MRHARLAHHLTRGPTGIFHFRLAVPADLRAIVGRSVIKQSLGTRAPSVAVVWAQTLAGLGMLCPSPHTEDVLCGSPADRRHPARCARRTLEGLHDSRQPRRWFFDHGERPGRSCDGLRGDRQDPRQLGRQAAAASIAAAAQAAAKRIRLTLADASRTSEGPGLIVNTCDARKRSCKSFVNTQRNSALMQTVGLPIAFWSTVCVGASPRTPALCAAGACADRVDHKCRTDQ
jgi:hypothetical protein